MFCLYTFPAHNLNFHRQWWDWIQAIFLNLFYFTSKSAPASTADLKSQFCIFASFKVATLRFTPAIWLPSKFAPRRLQPVKKGFPNLHLLVCNHVGIRKYLLESWLVITHYITQGWRKFWGGTIVFFFFVLFSVLAKIGTPLPPVLLCLHYQSCYVFKSDSNQ